MIIEGERLPCGCVMGNTDDGVFFYMPCSLLCEFYLYAMNQAKKAGTEIITRVME
jgi:hypothetical protein